SGFRSRICGGQARRQSHPQNCLGLDQARAPGWSFHFPGRGTPTSVGNGGSTKGKGAVEASRRLGILEYQLHLWPAREWPASAGSSPPRAGRGTIPFQRDAPCRSALLRRTRPQNRRTCIFRVEVERIKGTGKCQLASPNRGDVADALRISYDQVKKHLTDLGIKDSLAQWDLRVQVANPMEADEPSLLGMAVYVAIVSALRGQPIEMGTVLSGEMSVQGNLEGIDSVGEVIMIAREYGAVRIALPSLCELDVSNVPGELTKNIEIVYYDQPSVLVDRVLTK